MKNYIKTIATTIAMSALLSHTAMAGNKGGNIPDFIVNGVILKTDKKTDSKCKLELFIENTLVESSEIKMNKIFERKLKRNVWYTIRVTKEGYKPLLISINTTLEQNAQVLDNIFEFETELIDNEMARYLNQDQIDFPVGYVAFNNESKKFEANDIYTKNYIAALYDTKEEHLGDVTAVYTNNKIIMADAADIAKEYVTSRNKIMEGLC
ncbi:MAG: hypothetical protein SGJ15_01840 [Bacteroidota bacterium]|nr:hypothetical protein [Bacteroidota bacterium]